MTTPVARTEGAKLLRAVVQRFGVDEVARKVKSTPGAVEHWVAHRRRPAADGRQRLLRFYDIPLDAWETRTPATTTKPPPAATPSDPALEADIPTEMTAKEIARQHIGSIRRRIAKAEVEGKGERELSTLYNSYTAALRMYSRLSGELEITESMLVRSSAFATFLAKLKPILEKYPDFAREAAHLLGAFAERGA